MEREKMFVEYPLCLNFKMAVAWMEAGHELWQEISDEFPECGGFDDIDCLIENFPEWELNESDNIHLVPITPEMTTEAEMNEENCTGGLLTEKQKQNTIEHLKKYNVIVPE